MFQENLENFCNFCAQTNGNSPVCAQNELSQFSLCNQIRFGIIKAKTSLTKPQTAVKNEFNDVNLYKQFCVRDFSDVRAPLKFAAMFMYTLPSLPLDHQLLLPQVNKH